MKLARMVVIAVAILVVAAAAWAQRPDFSGTWTLDPAGGREGGGGALAAGQATIKQTADALTIERTMGITKATTTYKLDGTDSRNMLIGPDGGRLSEFTPVRSVAGNTLTVETTSARSTQKWVYKK